MHSQILMITGLAFLGTVLLSIVVFVLNSKHFRGKFNSDVAVLLRRNHPDNADLLTEEDLVKVPPVVKNYIIHSGALNKPKVKNFSVMLDGYLRRDERSPWMSFSSEQHNGVTLSERLFFMNAVMKRLPVSGYHRYVDGLATMNIRLLSLIPVQYADGAQMNTSETVTLFNDMCVMAPATLIDPRINWSRASNERVTATFNNAGILISADLSFNESSELINFISHDRYAVQQDRSMQRYPWLTPLRNYRDYDGIQIASYAETIIQYPAGDFCYGKFNVKDVRYNILP